MATAVAIPAGALPIAMAALAALGLFYSRNVDTWLLCVGSLWITILCIGGTKAHPVFWWFIVLSWSRVFADVLLADISGLSLGEADYRKVAIVYSLVALFFIACGIRGGFKGVTSAGKEYLQNGRIWTPSLKQVFLIYLCGFPFFGLAAVAASLSGGTRQIFGSFMILKIVLLYCLAATVYRTGRGYSVLILVLAGEVLLGFSGFFSEFKEPLIVAFIAALYSRPAGRMGADLTKRYAVIALLGGLVIWLSLIWSAIKPEYREWLNEGTGSQVVMRTLPERLNWLSDNVLVSGNIEYNEAARSLLSRIAYTNYYATMLERRDADLISLGESRWLEAFKVIIMPRLLFPNKAVVDDSEVTRRLTGISVNPGTSISIGYIAETHLDFGFPLMLIPLLGIGFAMGRVARAFANMEAPNIIRNAFVCAAIVGAFGFESNIDKVIPAFVLSCGALAVSARFGHMLWHRGPDRRDREHGQTHR
jgi:hypothetical protein